MVFEQRKSWPLQDARDHLSEVVQRALLEGPQRITRHGKETVVVVSADQYARLTAPAVSLVEFFRTSPLAETLREHDMDFERLRDEPRDLDL